VYLVKFIQDFVDIDYYLVIYNKCVINVTYTPTGMSNIKKNYFYNFNNLHVETLTSFVPKAIQLDMYILYTNTYVKH
jgi:hypothetical protein